MRTWTLGPDSIVGKGPRPIPECEVFEAEPVLDLLERFVNEADAKWPRGQAKKLPGPTMYGVISDARHLLIAHGRRGTGA